MRFAPGYRPHRRNFAGCARSEVKIARTMLKVGFGQADITPPVEGSMIGSVHPRPITGVHDPLLATACVIDDGATPLALLGIDAGVIQRETADAACQRIEQQTGIPLQNVIISA